MELDNVVPSINLGQDDNVEPVYGDSSSSSSSTPGGPIISSSSSTAGPIGEKLHENSIAADLLNAEDPEGDALIGAFINEHVEALSGDDVEWVECEEDSNRDEILGGGDHSIDLKWRILIAMIAITLVAAFFYMLEKRRRKNEPHAKDDVAAAAALTKETSRPTHLDPLSMVGIDFVPKQVDQEIDEVAISPDRPPAMIVTTPGGTENWEEEFYARYQEKVADKVEREKIEEEEENRGNRVGNGHLKHPDADRSSLGTDQSELNEEESDKLVLEDVLVRKLITENATENAGILERKSELIEQEVQLDGGDVEQNGSAAGEVSKDQEGQRTADDHIDHDHHEDERPTDLECGHKAYGIDQSANRDIGQATELGPGSMDSNGRAVTPDGDHVPDQPATVKDGPDDAELIASLNRELHSHPDGQAGPIHEGDREVTADEFVNIHSPSQADSVHAAAVGDDYDHVTVDVQLTAPSRKRSTKAGIKREGVFGTTTAEGNEIEENGNRRGSDAKVDAGSHKLIDQNGGERSQDRCVDSVDQTGQSDGDLREKIDQQESEDAIAAEKLDGQDAQLINELLEEASSSLSRSDDPVSLCEHTTAPEIETYEVSDVDLEQDDDEVVPEDEDNKLSQANLSPATPAANHNRSKKNGSPPVILTQVTSTPPPGNRQHRRANANNGGIRLVKVEAMIEEGAGGGGSEEDDDDAPKSSMFEVIGARNMHEALMKMETLEAVTRVMRLAGLEESSLIFGIDYTASNKYQGEKSFDGNSLHKVLEDRSNPYQQVIAIMGQTLAPFAQSGSIPAYGFGDIRTMDTSIFPLKASGYCKSFSEVLEVYNEITPKVVLSGPTNFAPLIYQSIEICKEFKCYHILVIVADGQVTNERATRRAIVDACRYPLSIIVVGVGDGPWDMMRIFDEKLPKRPWDNFHFVEFYKVTAGAKQPDLAFAVQSLLEIPDQYKQIKALGLLNFVK